jgi:hypothetical protein
LPLTLERDKVTEHIENVVLFMPLRGVALPDACALEPAFYTGYVLGLLSLCVVPEAVRVPKRTMRGVLKSASTVRGRGSGQKPAPRGEDSIYFVHKTDGAERAVVAPVLAGGICAVRDVL